MIYAVGPCSLSLCAPADLVENEVEDEANAQHPTGITSRWAIAEEGEFRTGEPNPCPCNNDPDNRRHWLLHC